MYIRTQGRACLSFLGQFFPSSLLHPSLATRYQNAAGWIESEHLARDAGDEVERSKRPSCFSFGKAGESKRALVEMQRLAVQPLTEIK